MKSKIGNKKSDKKKRKHIDIEENSKTYDHNDIPSKQIKKSKKNKSRRNKPISMSQDQVNAILRLEIEDQEPNQVEKPEPKQEAEE
jgi:hypothetical protein